jgi:hypothetical protein
MIDRLDEERLEILRSWGAGLSADHREELRAAGKAITVLIEEIDRLQIDLWNARATRPEPEPESEPEPTPAPTTATVAETLVERVTEHVTAPASAPASSPPPVTTQGSALRDRLSRSPKPRAV